MDTQPEILNWESKQASSIAWRNNTAQQNARLLPEEMPIALTYNRVTFAVMMASPCDLRDFAIGFSKSEGIIEDVSEIQDLEILVVENGIECRMSLNTARATVLDARRRKIAGPVGCGLCGMESLEQAVLPARRVSASLRIPASSIADGFARMEKLQVLNQETHAVHAAAFLNAATADLLLREDIGRHNALDKLIGAALAKNEAPGGGALLVTSRLSIELIQKAATFGAPILAAISVPTARAVREAERAGITLIGVARRDGFEIFSHPERVSLDRQYNAVDR